MFAREVNMDNIKEVESQIVRVNKGDLVKQHNALIYSKHDLTQTQMKIILSVIGKIRKDDEDFKNYSFYIKDFLDIVSNTDTEWKKNYKFIVESVKGILSKPLCISTKKGHLICNWLSGVETEKDSGMITIRFDPALKPYLLQLKEQFTTFKLEHVLVLNSIYSIRIYELLKQFESTGFRAISMEEFKRILEIPNSYMLNNIKNILDRAKKEISEKTDIEFIYSLKKQGRKFASITFNIRPKAKPKAKLPGQTAMEEEEKRPSNEEIAKECFAKNAQNGQCSFKNSLFKPPYCKFCKIQTE